MLDGYIRTTADQGDDRAVQDVMSLYGIPLVKETTANTLVVGSELLPDRVVTSLAWQGKTWQETHEIVIFHAQDQAAPGRVVRRNLALLLEQAVQLPRSSWGILRGVRPGKIVRRLFDEGYTKADIAAVFEQEYLAAPEKAALLLEIALRQRVLVEGGRGAGAGRAACGHRACGGVRGYGRCGRGCPACGDGRCADPRAGQPCGGGAGA